MSAKQADHYKTFVGMKETLTAFQRSLHMPEDVKKGPAYAGNQITTPFYKQYKKATWYYHFDQPLDATMPDVVDNHEGCTYTVQSRPHGLLKTDLCQELPPVVCNPGYEAAWTYNVGSNIMVDGTMIFNDVRLQYVDQIYNDGFGQSGIPEDQRTDYEKNLGNIGMLGTWQDVLPKFITSYAPPWFYSKDLSNYFPLYFCGFLDKVIHRISLRRNIGDLLRVREKDTGKLVPVDPISIKSINGRPVSEVSIKLQPPIMYGQFLYLTEDECSYNRCADSGEKRNILHVEDIYADQTRNPVRLDTSYEFKINNTEYPVHNIMWMAQNETAKAENYYSNYTTNPSDHASGWSPLESITINPGRGPIVQNMPGWRTERVHPGRQNICSPKVQGMGFWSPAVRASEHNAVPGIVFKNGSITINLKDSNSFIGLKYDEKASTDLFTIHIRLVYLKRVVFKDYPRDEADRTSKRSVVEIQGAESEEKKSS